MTNYLGLDPEFLAKKKRLKIDDYYDLLVNLQIRQKANLEQVYEPGEVAEKMRSAGRELLYDIYDYEDPSDPGPDVYLNKGLELLRKLYLPGGPLHDTPMTPVWYIPKEGVVKYAPLVHLVMTEPQHFGHLQDAVFETLMTAILWKRALAKGVGKHIKAMGGKEASVQYTELIEHLCKNTHKYVNSYSSVAGVQDLGGLQWLKDRGADIPKCLDRFLDGIETTEANNKSFGQMFRVTMDCINELESTGQLSPEDAKLKRGSVLIGALEVSGRQKARDAEFWRPIIKEAMSNSSAQPDVRQILSYAFCTPDTEVDKALCLRLCQDQVAEVKKVIKRDFGGEAGYRVVVSAGIESLFKPNELYVLMGKTFTAELGV
jgi:hypothetical protein